MHIAVFVEEVDDSDLMLSERCVFLFILMNCS